MLKKNTAKQTDQMIKQNKISHSGRPLTTRPKEGLSLFMGQGLPELEKEMGQPKRIDQTTYGYKWYVFKNDYTHYFQAGVENNRIVTIFAIGDGLDVAPFEIGQPLEEIFNTQYIDPSIDINLDGNTYRFELNDTDINLRPLVQLGDIYAQLYFDKVTGTLSGVRFLDTETLMKLKPYELVYNGELKNPSPANHTQWEESNKGTEKEIADITNVLRIRNNLKPLKWDEKTAEAAFEHSRDMYESGKSSGSPSKYVSINERLNSAGIAYKSAGENIAANYADGPSAVEGWLNSDVHRAALLNKSFTHIGVGVFHEYYTQDFIQKKSAK